MSQQNSRQVCENEPQKENIANDVIDVKKIDDIIDLDFLNLHTNKQILTPDQGIIKYIIQEGNNKQKEQMELGATVYAFIEVRSKHGKLLNKQYRGNKQKIKIYSDPKYIIGLQMALFSMKEQEVAWFKIEPKYQTYSCNDEAKQINIAFDNDTQFFKIRFEQYINIPKPIAVDDYTYRKNQIVEARQLGNQAYKENKFDFAIKKYNKGINVLRGMPKLIIQKMSVEELQFIEQYKIILLNNVALCQLKLQQFQNVIETSLQVIQCCSDNLKAHNFLGKVYFELHDYEKALLYYKKCIQLSPGDEDFQQKFKQCQYEVNKWQTQKQKEKEKKMYQQMLQFSSLQETKAVSNNYQEFDNINQDDNQDIEDYFDQNNDEDFINKMQEGLILDSSTFDTQFNKFKIN